MKRSRRQLELEELQSSIDSGSIYNDVESSRESEVDSDEGNMERGLGVNNIATELEGRSSNNEESQLDSGSIYNDVESSRESEVDSDEGNMERGLGVNNIATELEGRSSNNEESQLDSGSIYNDVESSRESEVDSDEGNMERGLGVNNIATELEGRSNNNNESHLEEGSDHNYGNETNGISINGTNTNLNLIPISQTVAATAVINNNLYGFIKTESEGINNQALVLKNGNERSFKLTSLNEAVIPLERVPLNYGLTSLDPRQKMVDHFNFQSLRDLGLPMGCVGNYFRPEVLQHLIYSVDELRLIGIVDLHQFGFDSQNLFNYKPFTELENTFIIEYLADNGISNDSWDSLATELNRIPFYVIRQWDNIKNEVDEEVMKTILDKPIYPVIPYSTPHIEDVLLIRSYLTFCFNKEAGKPLPYLSELLFVISKYMRSTSIASMHRVQVQLMPNLREAVHYLIDVLQGKTSLNFNSYLKMGYYSNKFVPANIAYNQYLYTEEELRNLGLVDVGFLGFVDQPKYFQEENSFDDLELSTIRSEMSTIPAGRRLYLHLFNTGLINRTPFNIEARFKNNLERKKLFPNGANTVASQSSRHFDKEQLIMVIRCLLTYASNMSFPIPLTHLEPHVFIGIAQLFQTKNCFDIREFYDTQLEPFGLKAFEFLAVQETYRHVKDYVELTAGN
ncbi:uncharacterized protein KGF55_002658 [Candida pseudojiufengensis]|uniref:uncharacterized protein n=1 Tax=Candida pseudojiufengensis TaxID=497109 RepID=UPI002225B0D3|nr:uncharacterized protein KGF55_002658 [Candida pseudojiufengensis]KAI5963778.1 hypothetical protein KGF55_002658 [Candida pseudojiufengensis]